MESKPRPPLEERVYLVTGATKGHGHDLRYAKTECWSSGPGATGLETAMRLLDSGCSATSSASHQPLLYMILLERSSFTASQKASICERQIAV